MPPPPSAGLRLPLGISDFRQLRGIGAVYVDKTRFITDLLAGHASVALFPRPRRFGKTLNLSTLRYFLEKSEEDRTALFEGLSVWDSREAREHFQRYPVIFLTFKDVKASTFEAAFAAIRSQIRQAYIDHAYLLKQGALDPWDTPPFEQILRGEGSEQLYTESLRVLSSHLARYHGEGAVILIDEYDTPIHAAVNGPHERAALDFFRLFLSAALKDNPHLERGVLTGILRVAKENLFSGLNNLAVYSLLRSEHATSFGFTEDEVRDLAILTGCESRIPDLQAWYNGYRFGGHVVYNPWSILSFLASEDKLLRPYWVHTSSEELLRRIIFAHGLGEQGELETLLRGGEIEKAVDDRIALRDLDQSPEAVWSFLLFTGHLKATSVRMDVARTIATLAVPNLEVAYVYDTIFRTWLAQRLGGSGQVNNLLQAVLSGDAESSERLLCQLLQSLSVHDTAVRPARRTDADIDRDLNTDAPLTNVTPEQVYHVFVVGLLLGLQPRFDVRSNRESGTGRYDVMITPRTPGHPGVVMELKVRNPRKRETAKALLTAALHQLRDRDYAADLRAHGATPIHEMAIVFDTKRAWVQVAPPAAKRPTAKRPAAKSPTPDKPLRSPRRKPSTARPAPRKSPPPKKH